MVVAWIGRKLAIIQGPNAGTTSQERIAICVVLHQHHIPVFHWTDVQGEECGGAGRVAGEMECDEEEREVQVVDEVGVQVEVSGCYWS